MHQHPRPSPLMASPASSPATNPQRTNNPREESRASSSKPTSEIPVYNEADDKPLGGDEGNSTSSGPTKDTVKKLDQIIQNFHTKAAIVILQSRVSLPVIITKDGTKKVNKWFQLETDDTDAYKEELRQWKTCGAFENRPSPLIIETYLTANDLKKQSLVILDENGGRHDALEALNASTRRGDSTNRHMSPVTEIVLERWRVELKDSLAVQSGDFGSILPSIYKKSIVFFRSLYATTKFVPAWRYARMAAKSGSLLVRCRVLNGDELRSRDNELLTLPLYDSEHPVTTTFSLGEIDSPAGRLSAELCYRNDCNFRVVASESVLSSRYMRDDQQYFEPSLSLKDDQTRRSNKAVEVGSLPIHRGRQEDTEPTQAYGSLSTFHGDAPPLGTSPISALRAARVPGSGANSPLAGSLADSKPPQPVRPSSMRALEGMVGRRPSNPFKTPSLSSSPIIPAPISQGADVLPLSSPHSFTRTSGISALAQARNRSSLTAGMPASLRGVPIVPENAIASSASASPKPAPISRYSSSFSHRRGKLSLGSSKVDDDQGSSGKQSLSSSSAQPGSGILAEGGAGGSSGSLQTDDDQISDFLKLLDSKKTLQSFEKSPGTDASAKRTNAQLSRFQLMKDSHSALTDSMSSSLLLHRSSSSSSRYLSSVPPMVAATSMSTSSSPGKPVSPHTPHTPAIPSRLSANSIVDYAPARTSVRSRRTQEVPIRDVSGEDDNSNGTTAIDIPTSPRPYYPHNRRSSSVAQQRRSIAVEEDIGELQYGPTRSISLGADDREPPSLSALLGVGQVSETAAEESSAEHILQPAPHIREASASLARHSPASPEESQLPPRGLLPGSLNSPYRARLERTGGRGYTPSQTGSDSSLVGDRGAGSGHSERPGARHPPRAQMDDDEPLLFDMSEIGRDQSRRSLEDGRGGGSIGGSSSERTGVEPWRGFGSGPHIRRGSRRGAS